MSGQRRVLVTGANGFIGRHALRPLLERGFAVHAVTRGKPPPDEGDVHWHVHDLLADPVSIVHEVRPSHLLHLAWCTEPGAFWNARENVHWVAASVRLAEAFDAAGGQRAVMAGTCAEYDWAGTAAVGQLAEDAPLRPGTRYGACKDATRRVVEQIVPALAWGRVFFLYGPGEDQRRLVAAVARGLLAGERVPTTAGTQRRDFLHVTDAGAAFAALTDSEVTGAVNIASGEGTAVRDVVAMLADAAGRPDLLDVGALPLRPGEPDSLVADVRRLRDEVGFRQRWALRDGLADTLGWWRR